MLRHHKPYSLLTLSVAFFLGSCKDRPSETSQVKKETHHQTIVETGELAAVETRSFILPSFGRYWYRAKIIGMLEHGTTVQAGDSVIQLDPSEIKKYIIDRESDLETQQAALERLIINQKNDLDALLTKQKNALASFNLKKLEIEASRFESGRTRKIKELEFQQQKLELEKINRNLELNKSIARNDIKIQKIKVEQIDKNLKSTYEILPKLTIRTPISGVFQVATNRRTGNMVRIGDELYQGNSIGNVPNLDKMKVNTTISEKDYYKIHPGQKVVIRLDAMPDVAFPGEVGYMGKLCHRKNDQTYQKIFDVEVNLLTRDERLKPGMTVRCEFFRREN